ncbi:MAG: DUF3320 domain-containing protein [Acidobacteriota bacterium]
MSLTVRELLDRSRRELLDLSARNRLLSIPVNSKSARIVQVHDELSEQLFRLLVVEKKTLSFLPGQQARGVQLFDTDGSPETGTDLKDEEIGLPQPENDEEPTIGLARRHVDTRLQTTLSPEGLQRRLLGLYGDARTIIEEQGVNILYLALGHLKWLEAEQSDTPRYAPLILVPVELQRKTASERFHLRWREEDIQENLSLAEKLKTEFAIKLPPFPEDDDFSVSKYFEEVTNTIATAKRWEVLPNAITLGFFSFAKFLMYRDLDPKNWPDGDMLLKHHCLTGLLLDGFPHGEPLLSGEVHLDELIPASRLDHVVDADGSQTLAIEEVRRGRSLVIQGPPGTGKSQSITNLISTAVLDGKRVLFVAEKLAALEVVKRRLEREGLGPLCLELHSNKSNKRAVIDQIGRTWKLGHPRAPDHEALVPELEQSRGILNQHAKSLHERLTPSDLTPFFIMGRLTLLGDRGREATTVTFAGAKNWTAGDLRERRKLVYELTSRVNQIGLPGQHPWRGVCKGTVMQIDLAPLETLIRSFVSRLCELRETYQLVASSLSQSEPSNLLECERQRVTCEYVTKAPALDKQALCNGVWDAGINGLRDLVMEGLKLATVLTQVGSQVTESTWDKDFSQARANLAAYGRSLFRLFNGDYRRALAQMRGALTVQLPKAFSDRIAIADQIVTGQRSLRAIRKGDSLGQSAFGSLWRREKTDWNQLEAILNWVAKQREAGLDANFRQLFARLPDHDHVARIVETFTTRLSAVREEAKGLVNELDLDCHIAFGQKDIETVPLKALAERCQLWLSQMEALSHWNNYFIRARHARELGLASLVEGLETGAIHPEALLDCFDRAYFSELLRDVNRQKPNIVQFDGFLHDTRVLEFTQLDRKRLALAKYRTLLRHCQGMPLSNSGVGAAGIVKGELEKKRNLRTVRRLLKDAGSVVQAIKPVFMMSPLSVAQFLEPGAVEFDLLVIDEASQVQPVDALGAIARCKQIAVVGDSKQLPPTQFFTRLTTESSEPDDEEAAQVVEAKDIQSILGLCCASGLPETMLRWHYRSRHHSLIAVSNHEFYEDKLFIIPSPYSESTELGLKFNYVPEGVFDSGASATNRIEARAICRAVINHARKSPDLSLGIAAFSIRQRQAILDELELLRRENPDTEAFFNSHPTEPFFAKNLENVQGDERDVIFISVGYGKNAQGYMAMRFGPLSNEGGERRLNVLISRAKKRCEVFSSVTADDLDLNRASGRGVAALKTFLSFAETGRLAVAQQSGKEEESPFEEAVRRAVESLGYEVHPQVGISGFFIDLAVVDRERPGRYLLGIECDGAAYHSSRSARDRDRLRQAVLEDHGWVIHRIWSTDWFQRPKEQLQRVAAAIERAKVAVDETDHRGAPTSEMSVSAGCDVTIEREITPDRSGADLTGSATPYCEANFEVPRGRDPHQLATSEMAQILLRIVNQEGPIHEDELVVRVRDLWDLGRAGGRIQEAVASGVSSLVVSGRCIREDGFLSIPGAPVVVRNRESASSSLLKPERLPPAEIRAAILALIDANHGATQQEIPAAVANVLGFRRTSDQIRKAIDAQTVKLLQQGALCEINGLLKTAP